MLIAVRYQYRKKSKDEDILPEKRPHGLELLVQIRIDFPRIRLYAEKHDMKQFEERYSEDVSFPESPSTYAG